MDKNCGELVVGTVGTSFEISRDERIVGFHCNWDYSKAVKTITL